MLILGIIGGFVTLWAIILFVMSAHVIRSGQIGIVREWGEFVGIKKPGLRFTNPITQTLQKISTRTHEDEFPLQKETEARVGKDDEKLIHRAVYRIPQKEAKNAVFYIPKDPGAIDGEWITISYDEYIEYGIPTRIAEHEVKKQRLAAETETNEAIRDHLRQECSLLAEERKRWIDHRKETIEREALQKGLTTEMPFIVEWYIDSESIRDFIENTGSEKEVRKRLDDLISDLLQQYLGPTTAYHAATEAKVYIDREIQTRLRRYVGQKKDPLTHEPILSLTPKPFGININRAYMKPLDVGHIINKNRALAGGAVDEKNAKISRAEGEKAAIELTATANMQADIRKGIGEAGRLKPVLKMLRKDPKNVRFIMMNEAARDILPKSKLIVAPSDVGAYASIFALGGAVATIDKDDSPTPAAPAQPTPKSETRQASTKPGAKKQDRKDRGSGKK